MGKVARELAGLLALLVGILCWAGSLFVALLVLLEVAESLTLSERRDEVQWPDVLVAVAVFAFVLWPLFFGLAYYGMREDFERYRLVRWVRIARFLRRGSRKFFDDHGYPFARDEYGEHYLDARSARTVRPAVSPDYWVGGDVCVSFKLTGQRYDLSDCGGEWVWTDRRGRPIPNPLPDEPIMSFVPEDAKRWQRDREDPRAPGLVESREAQAT